MALDVLYMLSTKMENEKGLDTPEASCEALSHKPYGNLAMPQTKNDTYCVPGATHYLSTKDDQHSHTGFWSTPLELDGSVDIFHNGQTSETINNQSIIYKQYLSRK